MCRRAAYSLLLLVCPQLSLPLLPGSHSPQEEDVLEDLDMEWKPEVQARSGARPCRDDRFLATDMRYR